MRNTDLEPIAATLLSHGESAIAALVELIRTAVHASQDDHVTSLDRILRDVERITDSIRRI